MKLTLPCACLCLLTTLSLPLVAAEESVTRYEMLRRQLSLSSDTVLQYCQQNAPETELYLQAVYMSYRTNLDKAMRQWIAEDPKDNQAMQTRIATTSPEYKKAEAEFKELSHKLLILINDLDPHQYCTWATNNLENTTTDSILQTLHQFNTRVDNNLSTKAAANATAQ